MIVAEARADGAAVAEVARRHGANANMIFKWQRDHRFADDGEAVEFLPVEMGGKRPGGAVQGRAWIQGMRASISRFGQPSAMRSRVSFSQA